MRPRFVGRLGAADVITLSNAVLGFLAVSIAFADPRLAARLVLLGAVADGLDGVVARHAGSTPVGEYLDSLSDVASFGVAPAMLVTAVAVQAWGPIVPEPSARHVLAIGASALFLAVVVTRLGFYTAYDAESDRTKGVPSTLAGTIVAAVVLARVGGAPAVIGGAVVLAYLMGSTVEYPDLLARDAVIMGVVQTVAVVAPDHLGRAFPYALLVLALAYLVLAPRFYWRETG